MDWLAEEELLADVRSKVVSTRRLEFSSSTHENTVQYVNIAGVPLGFMLVGLLLYARRRAMGVQSTVVKGRQVGLVLVALITIGVAGLIGRVVSSDSDQIILSGLLTLAQDVVDRIEVQSDESGVQLVRQQDTWLVGTEPVFVPKLFQFWTAVKDIDGAQLIATNPKTTGPSA